MSALVIEPCENTDCEEGEHPFPQEGTRVRVIDTVTTREPGDDEFTEFEVKAGEDGMVISYVAEWHDVDVALVTRDGQRAWISFDNLEVIT